MKSISRNKRGRVEPDRQTDSRCTQDLEGYRFKTNGGDAGRVESSSRGKQGRVSRKRGMNFESTDEGFEGGSSTGMVERKEEGRKKKRKRKLKDESHGEDGNSRAASLSQRGGCQAEAFRRNRRTSGWTELQLLTIRRVVAPPPTTQSRRDDVPVSQSLGKSCLAVDVGSIFIFDAVECVADGQGWWVV